MNDISSAESTDEEEINKNFETSYIFQWTHAIVFVISTG